MGHLWSWKFRTITISYYKSAHAIIILYDITEQSSFDHISNWMIEIDKFAKQGVLRIIVGNKKDLESKRQVSTKDAESLADKYGIKFMEVSAKDKTTIEALFLDIVKDVYIYYMSYLRGEDKIDFDDMILQAIDELDRTNNYKYKYIVLFIL